LKSRSQVRVRYAETDKMGFVYYSNFFVYFEVARADFLRELKLPYRSMEEQDIFMPVTECGCRYRTPGRYDDELEIVTQLEMLSRLKLKFLYEVFRKGSDHPIADGFTVHVPVTSAGAPRRLPTGYLEALSASATPRPQI